MARRKAPAARPQAHRRRDGGKAGKRGKAAQTPAKAATQAVRGHVLSQPKDEPVVGAEFAEITDPKKRLYLQALVQGPRLGRAARAAGVSAKTAYLWRHDAADVPFQTGLQLALKLGIERAEGELWRRGIEGYESPVYHQGQLVGTELKFSDTAAIFMLKGAEPDKYRENTRHMHVGANGGPIQSQVQAQVQAQVAVLSDPQQALLQMQRMADALALHQAAQLPMLEGAQAAPEAPATPEAAYAAELAARNGGNGNNGGGHG